MICKLGYSQILMLCHKKALEADTIMCVSSSFEDEWVKMGDLIHPSSSGLWRVA